MKHTLDEIRREAERLKSLDGASPLPWFAHECKCKDCWCKCITTTDDPDNIEMDVCVAASGSLLAKDAELIVARVNSPLPAMTLELLAEHEAARVLLLQLGWRWTGSVWVRT